MSSQWSRLVAKPAGAIPGGLFGQIAVALTTLLIAAFIIAYAIQGGSGEEEPEARASEPVLAGEGIQRRVDHRIEEQQPARTDPQSGRGPRPATRTQMQQPAPGQQPGPAPACPVRTAGLTQGQTPMAGGQAYDADDGLDGMIEAQIAEQELLQELKLQSHPAAARVAALPAGRAFHAPPGPGQAPPGQTQVAAGSPIRNCAYPCTRRFGIPADPQPASRVRKHGEPRQPGRVLGRSVRTTHASAGPGRPTCDLPGRACGGSKPAACAFSGESRQGEDPCRSGRV